MYGKERVNVRTGVGNLLHICYTHVFRAASVLFQNLQKIALIKSLYFYTT
jgi:hypothetical protein